MSLTMRFSIRPGHPSGQPYVTYPVSKFSTALIDSWITMAFWDLGVVNLPSCESSDYLIAWSLPNQSGTLWWSDIYDVYTNDTVRNGYFDASEFSKRAIWDMLETWTRYAPPKAFDANSHLIIRCLPSHSVLFHCQIYQADPQPCPRRCEVMDPTEPPNEALVDFVTYHSLQGVVWHFPQEGFDKVRCYNSQTMLQLQTRRVFHPWGGMMSITEIQDPYTNEWVLAMYLNCCTNPNTQFDENMDMSIDENMSTTQKRKKLSRKSRRKNK